MSVRMQAMDVGSTPVRSERSERTGLLALARTESGKRWVMYGTVSGVAIATAWITTILAYNVFHQSLMSTQIWSVVVSTIPAFLLSRYWVWAKDGRVSMRREVIPFWVLSFVQFFISLGVVALAKDWIVSSFTSKPVQTGALLAVNLGTYGLMWVGKFFFLNNLLFRGSAAEQATA
jgi:putative flippase GtrA